MLAHAHIFSHALNKSSMYTGGHTHARMIDKNIRTYSASTSMQAVDAKTHPMVERVH